MKLPVSVCVSTFLVSCFASTVSSGVESTNVADKVLTGPAKVRESPGEPKASDESSGDFESAFNNIFSNCPENGNRKGFVMKSSVQRNSSRGLQKNSYMITLYDILVILD